MKVAIIPARGGSKRIPRKNVKIFCGKPMIAWSIEEAKASGCFDRIIVSTDDAEIAAISREWGAETPFFRPESISDDHTGTLPVIKHALNWLAESGYVIEYCCCLYATAPFVKSEDIRKGLSILQESGADYAFSITSFPFPIQRALRLTEQNRIQMYQPDKFNVRSQDLEEAWHDAGQFYWGRSDAWVGQRPIFSQASLPVFLPRHRVQDIDTPEDWVRAELLFKALEC